MKGKTWNWKEKLIEIIKESDLSEGEYEFFFFLFMRRSKKKKGD